MRLISAALLLFLTLLPGVGLAAGVFDVPASDKSMQYLGMIFGSMGSLPIQASGNPVFAQLIYIFNNIVFALAIVIIIVTSVLGVVSTAQEGETLGKKWSSVWVPFRAGVGVYVLLPTIGGYSWIQIIVMWLIIQGVGAANALWKQVIYSNQSQGSMVADTRQADLKNGLTTVTAIYKSVLCMNQINQLIINDPMVTQRMESDFVTAYPSADSSTVNFGRAGRTEAPICGSVSIPIVGGANPITKSSSATDPMVLERRRMLADAVIAAQNTLQPAAEEAALIPRDNWSLSSTWVSAARALKNGVQALSQTFASLDTHSQQAIKDGWIHAGSYYYILVQTGAYNDEKVNFTTTSMDAGRIHDLLGTTGDTMVNKVNTLATSYLSYVSTDPVLTAVSPADMLKDRIAVVDVEKPNVGGNIGNIFDAIFGDDFFVDIADELSQTITTGCLSDSTDPNAVKGDPLICMAGFGASMSNLAENVFWVALGTLFIIWLAASPLSSQSPIAHMTNFVLSILIPTATMMLFLIWSAGIALALYVPMIPYLVFLFASMTWIILVIEAMVGAPLIGLTLVVPSEDEIGKAGHAIVILLGLFLRPALMIVGFILAQKLLMVAIGILSYGFAGTMKMSLGGGVGLFGFVTLVVLYAGIAVSLVHEAFSLIYVLPDKTLRWMGIAGEGSEAGALTKEAEGSMKAGAAAGEGLMKGGIGFMQDKASSKFKSQGG